MPVMKIKPTILFLAGRRYLQKTLTQKTNIFQNEVRYSQPWERGWYPQINKVKYYHGSCYNLTRKNDELKQIAITVDDQDVTKPNHFYKKLLNPDQLVNNKLKETDYEEDDEDDEHTRRIRKPRGTHLKSGAVRKKPVVNKDGRLNALILVIVFMYLGGQLSSYGARILHDYEIFTIPDEDEYDYE